MRTDTGVANSTYDTIGVHAIKNSYGSYTATHDYSFIVNIIYNNGYIRLV